MNWSIFLNVLLFIITLLVSYQIIRWFQNPLRKLVLMTIPMKYRIRPNAYRMQLWIVNGAGLLMILLLATLLYFGIKNVGEDWLIKAQVAWKDKTEIPMEYNTPPPILSPMPPRVTPAPTYQPPTAAPIQEIPTNYEAPLTYAPPVAIAPSVPTISAQQLQPTIPIVTEEWYIQLAAFKEIAKAEQQCQAWQVKIGQPIRIGWVQEEYIPFKVLVGPFSSRHQAERYRKQLRKGGFSRPAPSIDYLLEE